MLINGKVLSTKQNTLFRANFYGGLEQNELLNMVPACNKGQMSTGFLSLKLQGFDIASKAWQLANIPGREPTKQQLKQAAFELYNLFL